MRDPSPGAAPDAVFQLDGAEWRSDEEATVLERSVVRVAVVDGDAVARRALDRLLAAPGREVVGFEDGIEALAEALEHRFDLVVTDVDMPRLDGISLCRALRERFHRGELRLLLVSAEASDEAFLEGLAAGADDCLAKPVSPALLRVKAARLLGERAAPPAPLLGDPDPLPCRFERYELLERIGRGGFSVVYAARDPDGREVALKLYERETLGDRERLTRALREVRVLGELDAPCVVRVLRSGFERGRLFLVMPRLPGRSAATLLRREGPLPVPLAAAIGRDVARALGALGEVGLVHRDVKPGNFVVSPAGSATLIDFGLVKSAEGAELTSADEVVGTAAYLAPELVEGADAHAGSDLYGLGTSLYELLTGIQPYTGARVFDVLRRIVRSSEAPRVRKVRPGVPEELDGLVARLMAPSSADRPGDPRAVAAALAVFAREDAARARARG